MRERSVTVAQLNEYVKGVFEDELVLHDLHVVGEVFECKQNNAATFVTLCEGDDLLHCVCFERIVPPEIGDKMSLFGSVRFYERTGRVSFVFRSAEKLGVGNLLAAFNARKDKLEREGLFAHKKPLPDVIRRVAVITSETGAVIHDFIRTVQRKYKNTDVYLYASSVQGKFAANDIVSRLQAADKMGYDVLVIARGGGSGDDLSVFNEESVVRAVAAAQTPTVSAVGHETDFTLCDFAASVRAGTPSMAGELISRRNEAFLQRLEDAAALLVRNIDRAANAKTNALYRCAAKISYGSEAKTERVRARIERLALAVARAATQRLADKEGVLSARAAKLQNGVQNALTNKAAILQTLSAKLDGNNPLRILSLGYAKLYDADGRTVCFDDVQSGDDVRAVLAEGTLFATVTEKRAK